MRDKAIEESIRKIAEIIYQTQRDYVADTSEYPSGLTVAKALHDAGYRNTSELNSSIKELITKLESSPEMHGDYQVDPLLFTELKNLLYRLGELKVLSDEKQDELLILTYQEMPSKFLAWSAGIDEGCNAQRNYDLEQLGVE